MIKSTKAKRVEYFTANRLMIARCRRGLTKRELAQRIGVSAQAITAFEDGSRTPADHHDLHQALIIENSLKAEKGKAPPDTVARMVEVLQFPREWFYADEINLRSVSELDLQPSRQHSAVTRAKAAASLEIAALISKEFCKGWQLPKMDVLDLRTDWLFNMPTEMVAEVLRDSHRMGVGPISRMVTLLETMGVHIYWWDEENTELLASGSAWHGDRLYIFINSRLSRLQARWRLAVELGRQIFGVYRVSLSGQQENDEAEEFARAFLMPRDGLAGHLNGCAFHRQEGITNDHAKHWGVSLDLLGQRAHELNIITKHGLEVFRRREDVRAEFSPHDRKQQEESHLQPQIFKMYEKAHPVTGLESLPAELALPWDIFAEMMPQAAVFRWNGQKRSALPQKRKPAPVFKGNEPFIPLRKV